MSEYETSDLLDMTAEIVSSYVSNNQVEADALPQLIRNIFETVSELAGDPPERLPMPPRHHDLHGLAGRPNDNPHLLTMPDLLIRESAVYRLKISIQSSPIPFPDDFDL